MKAKRSLAASKANWTRALRQAYPDGGPCLRAASGAEINREMLVRAMARTLLRHDAHCTAMQQLDDKLHRQRAELAQIERRIAAEKGGAS